MSKPAGTQPTPKSRSNYALFLGDLSIFCSEKDIEDLFQQYGEIVNVRIQRSKETSRALSYGFIEFSCETAAVTAMNELNGHVLKGRPLRIRWAAKRNQPVKSENTALHSAATIFVKFASQTGIIVTEEILREHFSVFGNILDTTIRTITIDEAFNRSKGYGFVNFVNSAEEDGLSAAVRASAEMQNATVGGVNYRCEVGYKHQQQVDLTTDSDSASAYSPSRCVALPNLSPKHMFSQQQQMMSSGASVHSVGSGSSMYSQNSPYAPHSPHPGMVSAISYVPSSGVSVSSMYQAQPQAAMYAPAMQYPAQAQVAQQNHYYSAPQQYAQVQQQQQCYAPQHGYAQQPSYYGAQGQQQQYYGSGHSQQGPYYGMPQQEVFPQQQQYYPMQPMVPPPPAMSSANMSPRARPPAPAAGAVEVVPDLTEQALSQHTTVRGRRNGMGPMPNAQQCGQPVVVEGRRSKRNISNRSNISDVTSATLNELQGDEEEEEVDDEEVPQPPVRAAPAPAQMAELTQALKNHLKSTLQTQTNNNGSNLNCKLNARRSRRSVSGGSNTTDITAAVLYDLRMQEQNLEKEEEEEGNMEPPHPNCTTPVASEPAIAVDATVAVSATSIPRQLTSTPESVVDEKEFVISINSPGKIESKKQQTPVSRRRSSVPSSVEQAAVALPAKSISPFTLSAASLAQLQSESEAADAASGKNQPERRSKRNTSNQSNQSDITAALAFMQVEFDEKMLSQDDGIDSFTPIKSAGNNCVCGKALSPASGSSSCPFGTTACSCVYSATC